MTYKKERKILFLSPYPVSYAPSQRFKYEQYYAHFEAAGYSLTTSSFVNKAFWSIIYQPGSFLSKAWYTSLGYFRRLGDLFRIRSFDVVYVHLWVTPLGPPVFEWLVKLLAKKLIYDLDDMIYLGHSSDANKFFMGIKGTSKMPYLIKHANNVIVTSDDLYEYASGINPHTTQISLTVDTERFKGRKSVQEGGDLIIGWTGTHSTSKYLNILDKVLQRLALEIDFQLVVIGDETFQCDDVNLVHKEWTVDSEVQELREFDIGLYPLPFEEWIMGKSGLKAISYMALEIPCVATAIGANKAVVIDGETGYLVKTEEEWYSRIKTLVDDPDLRRKMGTKGRQVAEEKFSVKANSAKYLEVFTSVMEQ